MGQNDYVLQSQRGHLSELDAKRIMDREIHPHVVHSIARPVLKVRMLP